eukprot:4063149-Pyramimonas_sp.AAC.1
MSTRATLTTRCGCAHNIYSMQAEQASAVGVVCVQCGFGRFDGQAPQAQPLAPPSVTRVPQ